MARNALVALTVVLVIGGVWALAGPHPKPEAPTSPMALDRPTLTVLGLPLGEELPAPTTDLASVRLDPRGIYSLQFPAPEGTRFDYAIVGGSMSDVLMESYPPQLGKGQTAMTGQGPSIAFKIVEHGAQPVVFDVTARFHDGLQAQKVLFLRTTAFDLTALEYVEGELLIGLAEGSAATSPGIEALLKGHDLALIDTLVGDRVLHVRDTRTPARDPFTLHDALIWEPLVRYAEPNGIVRAMAIE